MIYQGFEIISATDIDMGRLNKVGEDSTGWRTYYSYQDNNYILFYPFTEFHGGGTGYFIKINFNTFEDWIRLYPSFEQDIKELILKK